MDRPGCFFAVADDAPFIDTLPSIRWSKQQAVFPRDGYRCALTLR